jgi:hypothetical protein
LGRPRTIAAIRFDRLSPLESAQRRWLLPGAVPAPGKPTVTPRLASLPRRDATAFSLEPAPDERMWTALLYTTRMAKDESVGTLDMTTPCHLRNAPDDPRGFGSGCFLNVFPR